VANTAAVFAFHPGGKVEQGVRPQVVEVALAGAVTDAHEL
jgi:hypothetical protein